MLEIVALLLPIAAASGWIAASRHFRRKKSLHVLKGDSSSNEFVKGLNYLLNEQPQYNDELVGAPPPGQGNLTESQLVLGNLFRRSGEVERAIRLHQGLLCDSSLTEEQHVHAIFELGMDFMRAGLFGRAEKIFTELRDDRIYGESSLQQLLQIYQHEKEWLNAIHCSRQLKKLGKLRRGETIPQFFCELAEAAIKQGDLVEAGNYVGSALEDDSRCVRAKLLSAEIEIQRGRYLGALEILKNIGLPDSRTLGQLVGLMSQCYQQLDREHDRDQIDCLKNLHRRYPDSGLVPLLSKLIRERDGVGAAQKFMLNELSNNPSLTGLHNLLDLLFFDPPEDSKSMLLALRETASRLLSHTPIYRCTQCGFTGHEMHWRCPSCHHWETIAPVQEEDSQPGMH